MVKFSVRLSLPKSECIDSRTAKLHDEVELMKKTLGMKDDDADTNNDSRPAASKVWSLFNRKKRSLLSVMGEFITLVFLRLPYILAYKPRFFGQVYIE